MADIFRSYADDDRARAEAVVAGLRRIGWSVWWSGNLAVGTSFRREIRQQLRTARCVVVLWSNTSIDSDWVNDEAEDGKSRNMLVQAVLQPVQPPHGFRGHQWADLTSWDRDPEAAAFRRLALGVRRSLSAARREAAAISTGPGAASPAAMSPSEVQSPTDGIKLTREQRILLSYRADDAPDDASRLHERLEDELEPIRC
jgi:hypothetical protein